MNKIIIDTNEYNLDLIQDSYLDIRCNSIINLKVIKDNKINLMILNKFNNITINLEMFDNTSLEINSLGINATINYNLKQHNNSSLFVVSSILTKVDSINIINIRHVGNNNTTKFYTHGVNLENNKLYFNLNGVVNKNLIGCYLDEISKIINLMDGESKIIPNLIIDTKEVIANHSAFIGTFKIDDLYYLMSRGINRNYAYKLLIKSTLLANMNLDTNTFLKEISDFIGVGGEEIE